MSETTTAAPIEREDDTHRHSPGRRRTAVAVVLTLGLVAAIGAGVWLWSAAPNSGSESPTGSMAPAATVEVRRATLTASESWGGTLGHGARFTVKAATDGMVTQLADQGASIGRGTELYRLDEQPVIALIGTVPMYRDLTLGDTGADVEQLEANLARLGYDGLEVDDTFTWHTSQSVEAWQEDIGVEATGTVGRSDVVFLPRGGRIDNLEVDVGDTVTPDTPVLDITGPDQVVSLQVDVQDRELVEIDTPVAVRLPGGEEVTGTVTSSTVVEDTADDGDGQGGGGGSGDAPGSTDTITDVEVTLDDQVDESLLGSPVDVVVDVEDRQDVLVVPVNALLALAEGGFGLEVVDPDGTTTLVAVETGLFANGDVEVRGEGIEDGTIVGTAGR